MRHVSILLSAALLAACSTSTTQPAATPPEASSTEQAAQAPGEHQEGEAVPTKVTDAGTHFGAAFTVEQPMPVGSLLSDPAPHVGKTVRLSGTVVEVCEKRGCWLTLGAESGDVLRVKVDDGVMVFPLSSRGLSAQVEGTLEASTLSVEQLIERGKHHAEEQGETFDPATVTGPETKYQLVPAGVFIAS